MDNPTNNSISLHPDGYIEVLVRGDQSYLSFDQIRRDLERFIEKLKFEGRPLLGLVDLCEMSGFNTGSNKAAFEILETVPYEKVALFGGSGAVTAVTKLVIQAIGKSGSTRMFNDKAAALQWLLGKTQASTSA